MNEYIFVSTDRDYDDKTIIKIIAVDKNQALAKAYSYFRLGKLQIEEFNILVKNISMERICKIFEEFTNQKILYFSKVSDDYYVDELIDIDIIKCQ